jgi:hypothetical protein
MKKLFCRWGHSGSYTRQLRVRQATTTILNSLRTLRSYVAKVSGVYVLRRSAHSTLIARVAGLLTEIDSINSHLKETEHAKQLAEAQLMQLRVYQQEEGGRLGFMVSAFIPEEVIREMRDASSERKTTFKASIAESLVSRAVDGIFHLNKQGKMQALMFEPMHKIGSASDRVVSPVFETEKGRIKIH